MSTMHAPVEFGNVSLLDDGGDDCVVVRLVLRLGLDGLL
jgi:hypothetical protein